ncbi:NUDIX domain-containing protein [bacterium]|nr:NUDIX domain-containing protein [bacterium]
MKTIDLSIMCMIYKENGEFLVQERTKKDWPGVTFPGGKVEDDESILDACKREIKEETGLDIYNLECMSYIEWDTLTEGIRYVSILYRTKYYDGELKSSKEGKVFFIKEEDIHKYNLSHDFMKIYEIMRNGRKIEG